jgi:CheY-like chemotaxis protein
MRPAASIGRVRADPGQLEQVLLNLAVNARDAMPKGGTLTIETSNVDLDQDYAGRRSVVLHGKYVMLAVTDTGSGMDEATRTRVFEPFFTTKEVGRGTGLGLSTVYGIVKQSGGYIWVYSEPGQGTTFKIYLPSVDEEVSSSDGHTGQVAAGGAEVVLLVEDDEAVRVIGRRILERYGYTVLEAREGRDALRVAGQYPKRIDIVVTDMVMPELSGREVYQRLSSTRPGLRSTRPGLRVLFVSGYTDDDIVRRGLVDASAAFLQKPFTAMHLASAVRAVLDRRDMPAEPAA